jgi:hypothetical protein
MPTYTIIGNDLKEYGPVGEEQIREWIAEGRVDGRTKLKTGDNGEWKQLGDSPEWISELKKTSRPTCPSCGEPFEDGFDSCWKCGTGKDGSPPKRVHLENAEVNSEETDSRASCPRCGSKKLKQGKLLSGGDGSGVVFQPEGARFFTIFLGGGVSLPTETTSACLDCGLVWTELQPAILQNYVSKHCRVAGEEST